MPQVIISKITFSKVINAPIRVAGYLPVVACKNLFGEKHTPNHRMVVGSVFMITGVGVAKLFPEVIIVHYFMDLFGYAIHGMGLMPFLEQLVAFINKKAEEVTEADNLINSETKSITIK